MLPHDYHMHTNFSCDSSALMADMCRAAIAKGLPEIGFTEHLDHHPKDDCRGYLRPDDWWAELAKCRAEFAGRLIIRAGIEIGETHIYQAEAQAILARYPYDYALGSLHWIGPDSIFDMKFFEAHVEDTAYRLFYEELERLTRVGGFDVLSHFDVPVRTSYAVYGGYDPTSHEDYIRPVLKNCIERGLALDVNTAALRRRANVLTPGLDILRWYADMGGERVTLGSDSHRPEHVGAGLEVALDTIRAAGLKYVVQYEKRQAKMVRI